LSETCHFQRARAFVCHGIRAGEFRVGRLLPPTLDIAKKLHCGLSSVQRALTELSEEGILERVQKKGTRVIKRPYAGRTCVILSEDSHTNLIVQKELHEALLAADFLVNYIIPVTNGFETLLRHAQELSSRAAHTDSLVIIEPRIQELSAENYNSFMAMMARFPRTVCFSFQQFRRAENVTLVTMNQRQGAKFVIKHLLQLGHRKISVIAGSTRQTADADNTFGAESARYCQDLVEASGGEFIPHYMEDHFPAIIRMVKERRITAYWAVVDHYAAMLARECRAAGIRVPQDLSIVGRFNTPWSEAADPPITTLSVNPREVAQAIIGTLNRKGKLNYAIEPDTLLVTPELIVRESTGPVSH
jgi:DNA-binding LacI/PurR family transcriptional regulator/DNA-binding transcriptional regulator YhcF (GntR family)